MENKSIIEKLFARSKESKIHEVELPSLGIVKVREINTKEWNDLKLLIINDRNKFGEWQARLVSTALIEPNLNSADIINEAGCMFGYEVAEMLFTPAEFDKLISVIQDISGYGEINEDIKEIKKQ